MLPSPSFTNIRSQAVDKFNTLRTHAVIVSLLTKVLRNQNRPLSFVASRASGLYAKRLTGIHCVRLDQIVGTLQRTQDFDRNFRPLRKHLRDRWVNALLRLNSDGWEPVVVHKVGESYYVKDGHHRVSVAKSIGMMYIEAEVWDHNSHPTPRPICKPECQPIKRRIEAYSTNS